MKWAIAHLPPPWIRHCYRTPSFPFPPLLYIYIYIYIWVNCNFLVRFKFYLYFANNFRLPQLIQTIFLYVEPLWVPHCHTKFQHISSYHHWAIRNLLRKNVIFSWHVLRRGLFFIVKRQEEKKIIRLFCTAFDALLENITDFNLISDWLLRPPLILFDRHLYVFV